MAQADSIRRAMHAQPFRPFSLKLVDGSVHTVSHPDFIAIPPGRRPREVTFYVARPDGDGNADEYETHWIDLALILEVIVPESPSVATSPQSPANGA